MSPTTKIRALLKNACSLFTLFLKMSLIGGGVLFQRIAKLLFHYRSVLPYYYDSEMKSSLVVANKRISTLCATFYF
jgi:hypothetical protein